MGNIHTKNSYQQKSLVDELSEDRELDQKIVKSFYAKDTLSLDIFKKTDGSYKMDEAVRDKLITISDGFIDFLGIDFFVHDVVLTGSLANYNWFTFKFRKVTALGQGG